MEAFTLYKLPELPKPELFVPPPYCRNAERIRNGVEKLPSLNLIVSNPSKLLLLYEGLTDNSSKGLEVKINNYLIKEAACKSAFLMHLVSSCEEAVVQTLGREELEASLRYPLSEKVMIHLVNYENTFLKCDENWNPQIFAMFKEMFGDLSYNIVAVPILKKQTIYPCSTEKVQPVLLTCFVDSEKEEDYLVKLSNELFRYGLPVLLNLMTTEEEARQKQQYKSLLAIVRKLFLYLEDVNGLVKTITDESRKITNAKKGSLFLVNPDHIDLLSNVYNVSATNKQYAVVQNTKDHVIPDHVVTAGKVVNIPNISDHPLIDKSVTEFTGSEISNILCFPIRNESEIIGAVQLSNKRGGAFNHFDEEMANALGILCGESILRSLRFTQGENFRIRSQFANELMIYEMHEEEEEVQRKVTCPFIHMYPDFDKFTFSPRVVVQMETVCFVLIMFKELGFFAKFSIKRDTFTRFVAYVKKGCRDVPFHNWMHLFSTAHFAYLCLKNLQLVEKGYITHLEALAYFISCLCHDIDYRGTNNPFQQKSSSVLASLYSSAGSVMERHRLSQFLRILDIEECNFLAALDRQNYYLIVNLMKDLILATDLATHFKFYKQQYNMIRDGYNKNEPKHRYVFVSLLTTCADLSDHTKDWSVVKVVAEQLHEEFFRQGHLEKGIAKDPIKMEDSQNFFLPDVQIELLKEECLPAFKLLSTMFIPFKKLVHNIKRNILYWECSKHIFQKALDDGLSYTEVLENEEFDNNVEATIELLENTDNVAS